MALININFKVSSSLSKAFEWVDPWLGMGWTVKGLKIDPRASHDVPVLIQLVNPIQCAIYYV